MVEPPSWCSICCENEFGRNHLENRKKCMSMCVDTPLNPTVVAEDGDP